MNRDLTAFDTNVEPWHLPHITRALTGWHLDAKQVERETAALPLPDLLLKTGAMTGPHRRTHPITRRWRSLWADLLAFLAAPRIDLSTKDHE